MNYDYLAHYESMVSYFRAPVKPPPFVVKFKGGNCPSCSDAAMRPLRARHDGLYRISTFIPADGGTQVTTQLLSRTPMKPFIFETVS